VPTVCLDASVEELYRRCEQPDIIRPLRRSLEEFRRLYEDRRLSYDKATFRIRTDGQSIAAIVEDIISRLKLGSGVGASE
jgi:shikimate kinase